MIIYPVPKQCYSILITIAETDSYSYCLQYIQEFSNSRYHPPHPTGPK